MSFMVFLYFRCLYIIYNHGNKKNKCTCTVSSNTCLCHKQLNLYTRGNASYTFLGSSACASWVTVHSVLNVQNCIAKYNFSGSLHDGFCIV